MRSERQECGLRAQHSEKLFKVRYGPSSSASNGIVDDMLRRLRGPQRAPRTPIAVFAANDRLFFLTAVVPSQFDSECLGRA